MVRLVYVMVVCFLVAAANSAIAQQKPEDFVIYDSTQSKTLTVHRVQITPDRYWVVTTDYKNCGITDASLRVIVPVKYFLRLLHEDVIGACVDGRCGYIDVNGAVKLPFIYKETCDFSDGIAFVTDSNGNKYFIDHSGRKLFSGNYEMVDEFSEGLAIVYFHSRRGYINHRGKLVIPLTKKYTEASRFQNGRARVRRGDDYFIINRHGKIKARAGHWSPPPPL